ncbi:MAG: RNA-dependent DNA polymerase, partial [bacterium]|nr:RNA-dependent DNA polymerase [bacterium]
RRHLLRFRQKIRTFEDAFRQGEITEESLIRSVNSLVAHVSHADSYQMRKNVFHEK